MRMPVARHARGLVGVLLLLAALALVGCAGTAPRSAGPSAVAAVPAPGPAPDGLYADMGGQAGIEMLVVALLGHIADDPRIAAKFANVNLLNLNDRLVEQFCVVAGGPCTYTGKPMVEAHRHVDVGPADFNALVEDLQAAMDAQGIGQRAQNRFLARLAAMQRQVLHAPPKLDPAAPPVAIP